MTAPSLKEALEDLVRAVSNMRVPQNVAEAALQVNVTIGPVLERAKAALATFQPDGERREAIAFKIYSHSNNPKLWDHPNSVLARDNAYSIADLLLASGLVQDEAGWRDITTAPKDGTEILLFTHHEADEYLDESFDAVQIGWWDDGNHAPGSAFHRDAGWHQQKIGSATHWMPLPTPPIRDGGAS